MPKNFMDYESASAVLSEYADDINAQKPVIISYSEYQQLTPTEKAEHRWVIEGYPETPGGGGSAGENVDLSGNPLTFTTESAQVAKNVTITIEPIQSGSGDPSPSNPRTITGTSKLNLMSCANNLFNYEDVTLNGYLIDDGSFVSSPSSWCVTDYIEITGSYYTYYTSNGGSAPKGCWYDENKTFLSSFAQPDGVNIISKPSGAKYVRMSVWDKDRFILAQDILDIVIHLGSTVYGGTVDLASGELVINKVVTTIGALNWTYDSASTRFQSAEVSDMAYAVTRGLTMYSDIYKCIDDRRPFADVPDYSIYTGGQNKFIHVHDSRYTNASTFKSSLSSNKIVYPLAEPIVYSLSPNQLALFEGNNTVMVDASSIGLTYRGGKIAALEDLNDIAESINNIEKINETLGVHEAYVGGTPLVINKQPYQTIFICVGRGTGTQAVCMIAGSVTTINWLVTPTSGYVSITINSDMTQVTITNNMAGTTGRLSGFYILGT